MKTATPIELPPGYENYEAIPTPPQVPADKTAAALTELSAIVARANGVQVTTADEYAYACEVCTQIARTKKLRTEERLTITRKMDEAKATVMNFFQSTFLDPLERVDGILRGKLKAYDAEQRRIADEKRRQAEREAEVARQAAQRKAQEERERAAAKAKAEREEAERKRQEAERARQKEAEARAAGDAAAAKAAAAQARQLDTTASKAERKAEAIVTSSAAKVEQIEQHAASIVAPVILPEQPKAKGASRRTVWKFEVLDASKIDRRYLMPDEQKINRQVQALHREAVELVGEGGIRVWDEPDLSIKAAK